MATVKEIYLYLDSLAPFAHQESFDNAGFLVGRGEAPVTRIMVSLDITQEVADEAAEAGCQLIVAHHPVLFHPVKSITDSDPVGRCLLILAENRLAAICAHTNLDAAAGGVNDALAGRLGLSDIAQLRQAGIDANGNPFGIGKVGTVTEYSRAADFAAFVRDALGAKGLRLEDAGKPVRRVAVGGGACGDMIGDAAARGCDTFVTADVKYHQFLEARALGINLIDAGHFATENVICPVLSDWMRRGFPGTEVLQSRRHQEVFSCL